MVSGSAHDHQLEEPMFACYDRRWKMAGLIAEKSICGGTRSTAFNEEGQEEP